MELSNDLVSKSNGIYKIVLEIEESDMDGYIDSDNFDHSIVLDGYDGMTNISTKSLKNIKSSFYNIAMAKKMRNPSRGKNKESIKSLPIKLTNNLVDD